MRNLQSAAGYADIVDAYSPDDKGAVVRVGIAYSTFNTLSTTQQATKIAQYYGNVQRGLVEAEHAFKGLNRPFELDGDMHADKRVIIYSWRPEYDWVWSGSRSNGFPEKRTPPPSLVFVVLVLQAIEENGDVIGSIVQWNWVTEDSGLPRAPDKWNERYQRRLWSK